MMTLRLLFVTPNDGPRQMQCDHSMIRHEIARLDKVMRATSHTSHKNGELVPIMERRRSPWSTHVTSRMLWGSSTPNSAPKS
jgi:hypothetical protein